MAGVALTGLASGVDTSAIVDQLMAIEAKGKTRLQLRQNSLTAQQTTLKDLKTKLDALKAAAADLRSPSTWSETQTVESTDPRVAVARTGGAPIGGYSVKVTQLAASAQKTYGWTESAAASQLTFDGGSGPVTVDIAAGAKLADVASAINGRGDLPVYAASSAATSSSSSSRATGATVDFSATGGGLTGPTNAVAGRNAKYLLDGDTVERESATNVVEDAIPGVRLTFKGVTSDAAAVTVGAPGVDREKVKTEIKAFVDAYNARRQRHAHADQREARQGRRDADGLQQGRVLRRLRAQLDAVVAAQRGRRGLRAADRARPGLAVRHRHLDRQARLLERRHQGRPAADRRRQADGDARGRRPGRPQPLLRARRRRSPRTSRSSPTTSAATGVLDGERVERSAERDGHAARRQ